MGLSVVFGVSAAVGLALGCGSDAPSVEREAAVSALVRSFAIFDRAVDLGSDRIPEGGAVENVVVESSSIRHLAETGRYDLWAAHGLASTRRDWSVGLDPTEVCLYLGNRQKRIIAVNCAPRASAAMPGVLATVVSGGAAGAPGFRPGEFVYAAVLPDAVRRAQMLRLGRVVDSIVVVNNGFLYASRRRVDAVRYTTSTGTILRPVYACQSC